ncbi:Maf family protein [Rhodomicrobium vannielii]|uniref:Maf family protein n=1 Tax=Rhodomicrobium vannielii TaxID=1069 RepID=UPI002477CC51|nr:Maf family protein [Rhodomicrobium vannielii]
MMRGAGLTFRQVPADIDERAIEAGMASGLDPLPAPELAVRLAVAKAKSVSARHPETLVIGADQVMECGGVIFHKPADIAAARVQLLALRGRTHRLCCGLAVALGGRCLWDHLDEAKLEMRAFSEQFLDAYLDMEGEAVLQSVGGYRIEGPGVQLFRHISGDHFTIIGLPIMTLLAYLRECGAVAE